MADDSSRTSPDVGSDATIAPVGAGHDATLAAGSVAGDDARIVAGRDATIATSHDATLAAGSVASHDSRDSGSEATRDSGTEATRDSGTEATLSSGTAHTGGTRVVRPPQAVLPAPDYPDLTVVDPEHYVLGAKIAEGGMGQIRAARDRRLARPVAVKSLLYRHDDLAIRFEREARITARLQHPGIVQIHEAGQWPTGEPFFAMKLVEGRSLDDVIKDCKTLAERLALLPNVVAVAEAIAYAHDQHVIHRDIKPKNVLVGAFGETVVIDWGLAKDLRDVTAPELSAGPYRNGAHGSTVVGEVLGTPAYMPLEQARGEAVDERADVYSIGALIYHVLTGVAPYDGRTAVAVLESLKEAPPRPLGDLQAGLPPDLVAIVGKAMAREADGRYPSAKELAVDLRHFTTGQLVGAHEYSAWQLARRWVRRHRGVVIATLVAIVALVGFGTYSFRKVMHERDAAEAAEQKALERDERLAVEHARAIEADDPTMAVAALRTLAPESANWIGVRPLVVDAWRRGIAWRVLHGHDRTPQRVTFASDGRVISAGSEGTIRIWDAAGAAVGVLEGHRGNVNDVAVSRDGQWIATTGIDGTARLWRSAGGAAAAGRSLAPTGEVVTRLVGFTADGADVVLLTRAALLRCPVAGVTCTRLVAKAPRPTRGVVRTVIEASGREVTTRKTDTWTDRILTAAISPTSRTAVTCDLGRTTAWDLDTDKELWLEQSPTKGCGFSPSGQIAIVHTKTLGLVDARTGTVARTLEIDDQTDERIQLAYSPDGTRVALAGTSVDVWDLAATPAPEKPVASYDQVGEVSRVEFSPNGMQIASSAVDGVAIMTFRTGAEPDHVWRLPEAREVAFSPDGTVGTGYVDGSVRLWRPTKSRGSHVVFAGEIASVSASDDGARLGILTKERNLMVIAWRDGKVLADVAMDTGCIDASLSPDGEWGKRICKGVTHVFRVSDMREQQFEFPAATWLRGGRLLAWRWNTSTLTVIDLATAATRDIALAGDSITGTLPSGTTTITRGSAAESSIVQLRVARAAETAAVLTDAQLIFVDLATGKAIRATPAPCTVDAPIALAWDGRTFACGVGNEVWVAGVTGEPTELRGHYDQVNGLDFLADGSLASTARDDTLRTWSVVNGTSRAFPIGGEGAWARPVGGPGRTLLTEGSDVRVWDLEAGRSWTIPEGIQALPLGTGRAYAIASKEDVIVFTDDAPATPSDLARWIGTLTEATMR